MSVGRSLLAISPYSSHLNHTSPPPQLLNCIMDMVEKTRRSLTVLRRCQEADREEMNHWIRRYSDVEDMKKGGSNGQHRPPPPPHHHNSSNTANSSESQPIGTSTATGHVHRAQVFRGVQNEKCSKEQKYLCKSCLKQCIGRQREKGLLGLRLCVSVCVEWILKVRVCVFFRDP